MCVLEGEIIEGPMNENQENNILDDRIQREINKLDETNKKQEQRLRNLESQSVQNVNLYFIFQAVILASTTTSSSTTSCRNWWVPFTLSLLAAVTNLCSFCEVMLKVVNSREELDQNLLDISFMKLHQLGGAEINLVLPGNPLNHRGGEIVRPEVSTVKKWKRRLVVCLSVGLFIVFSSLVMYGCYSLLCHSSGDRKCVKLC